MVTPAITDLNDVVNVPEPPVFEEAPVAAAPSGPTPPTAPAGPDAATVHMAALLWQQERLKQENAQQGQALQWQQAQAAQERARADEESVFAEASRHAQEDAQLMIEQGWDQDKALITASAYYNGKAHQFLREQGREQGREQRKAQTVDYLSRASGIPPAMLQGYNDLQSMVAAAQQYARTSGPQNRQIAALQNQVAQLTRSQVPAQNYALPGRIAGTGRPIDVWNAYGRGDLPWSTQVQQAGKTLGLLT